MTEGIVVKKDRRGEFGLLVGLILVIFTTLSIVSAVSIFNEKVTVKKGSNVYARYTTALGMSTAHVRGWTK